MPFCSRQSVKRRTECFSASCRPSRGSTSIPGRRRPNWPDCRGDGDAEIDLIDRRHSRCAVATARPRADRRPPDCAPASRDGLVCGAVDAIARRHCGEQITGPGLGHPHGLHVRLPMDRVQPAAASSRARTRKPRPPASRPHPGHRCPLAPDGSCGQAHCLEQELSMADSNTPDECERPTGAGQAEPRERSAAKSGGHRNPARPQRRAGNPNARTMSGRLAVDPPLSIRGQLLVAPLSSFRGCRPGRTGRYGREHRPAPPPRNDQCT